MALTPLNAPAGAALSWAATALNVSLHFTQVPLVLQMLRDPDASSRARFSSWPAVFQAAACAQWLLYAVFVLPSPALVANNAVGLAVSLAYVAAFVAARPAPRAKLAAAAQWAAAVALALATYGALFSLSAARPPPAEAAARDAWAVAVTTAVTISLWASPLVALRAAARERDARRVPVPLTLVMLATTALWLVVGALVGDMALVVCSVFGVALSALQLAVLLWIRRQPPLAQAAAEAAPAAAAEEEGRVIGKWPGAEGASGGRDGEGEDRARLALVAGAVVDVGAVGAEGKGERGTGGRGGGGGGGEGGGGGGGKGEGGGGLVGV